MAKYTIERFLMMLCVILVLAGCSDDSDVKKEEEDTADATRTYDEAFEEYNALRDILIDLTTSEGLTREANFPTSGTVTYKGVHEGVFFNGNTTSTTQLDYVGDVEFTLDFATGKYTGTISNVTTNLEGYEHPEGTFDINGSVREPAELGGDEFGLTFIIKDGPLTKDERTATFDGVTSDKGRFYGKKAQYIAIGVTATFVWTAGPDAGTTSGTKGFVYVMAED